jgi:WD40 repeat protein
MAEAPPLPFTSTDMVIGPGGRYVAFPEQDEYYFQIRDVATGALGPASAPEDGRFISFSPDGSRYITGVDGRLRVWDRETGAILADSEGSGYFFPEFPAGEKAVFTPDGHHVVALLAEPPPSEDSAEDLVVLDATTLAPVGGAPVPLGSVGRQLSVMPDGRTAVVVTSRIDDPAETKVLLVDLETRRIVRSTPVEALDRREGGARNNTVAPDGRTVGIGGTNGDAMVVDAVSGEVRPFLQAHDGFVESVTVAPDLATVVTTGRDGAVKLWDTETQQLLGPCCRWARTIAFARRSSTPSGC